jgi:hypothetical protein
VREPRLRSGQRGARRGEREQAGLEREAAERQENAWLRNERDLSDEVLPAVRELLGKRSVIGRRALHRCRQKGTEELEAVSRANRFRPVGEPDGVNRPKQEVSRLVARENAAGPVSAVSGGSETDDQETRPRVSKRGQRPAPVFLSAEPAGRTTGGFFAPGDEAGTAAAPDDAALEPRPGVGGLQRRVYFPVSRLSASTWPRNAARSWAFVVSPGSPRG